MAKPKSSNRKPAKHSNHSRQDELTNFDDIREQAVAVGEDLRGLAKTAGQAAIDQMDPIEKYIREKPMKSVLIAAGIGALFGAVFLRRR